MPEYIDTEVDALRESDSDGDVTLLLGVSGDRDEFGVWVGETGATVDATIGQATMRVTAPEAAVDALCELDGLNSTD